MFISFFLLNVLWSTIKTIFYFWKVCKSYCHINILDLINFNLVLTPAADGRFCGFHNIISLIKFIPSSLLCGIKDFKGVATVWGHLKFIAIASLIPSGHSSYNNKKIFDFCVIPPLMTFTEISYEKIVCNNNGIL